MFLVLFSLIFAYTGPLPDFVADQNNAIFDCEASPRKLLVPQLGDTGYDWASPTMVDWNNDGLFDLLVGYNIQKPDSLKLVVFINHGSVGNPRFTGKPSDSTCFFVKVKYPGQSFFRDFASLGAHPTADNGDGTIDWHTWLGFVPSIIDWNHDGRFDILVSEGSCDINCGCCGLVACGNAWDRRGTWLLINTGAPGRPEFGRAANMNYDPYNARSPASGIPSDSFAGLDLFQQMSCDGNFPQATVVDWNSDRIPDLCFAVSGAQICLGDTFADGRWKPKTNNWLSQTPANYADFGQHPLLRTADFNNDGKNELLSCKSDVSEFLLFERNPNTASPQYYIGYTLLYKRVSGDYPKYTVGDFDEDGDMDVLCGWGRTSFFAILVYRTPGGTPGSHPYAALEQSVHNQDGNQGPFISTFPNPFNAAAQFTLSGIGALGQEVSLRIYDAQGKLVEDLSKSVRGYRVSWNASRCASGVYIAVLKSGNRTLKQRVVVLR
jgi:hypothetical protein